MRPSTLTNSRETNTYFSSKSATAAARAGRPLGQAATTSGAPPSAISSSLTTRESSSRSSSLPPLGSDGDVLRTVPVNNLGVVPSGRALGRVKSAASLRGEVDWVFRSTFNKVHYKGHQREIMEAAILGSDVLVIAPTGMGKSMCFQVPAVADEHGLTLVLSPLLSLMQDQVESLKSIGVAAAMLSSKTSQEEQNAILRDMESGHPINRLLYITPERLSSAAFKRRLAVIHKQRELNRLVVDEAHCISEWGHDFRPDYHKIGTFRVEYPNVPIMALTASATPKVQDDIVKELGLDTKTLQKFVHEFNRKNLYYEIRYFSESEVAGGGIAFRQNDILAFINRHANKKSTALSGIVYCRTKNSCDQLATFLQANGVLAAPYHRGMKDAEADLNQQRWLNNQKLQEEGKPRVDCIVATVAFGMGIDKGDCRYVIHYDIPKSFEGFYQETGRAGRDNNASRCVMYYSAEDKARVMLLVAKTYGARQRRFEQDIGPSPSQRSPNSIEALVNFAESASKCRHVSICQYFGEAVTQQDAAAVCGGYCDVCKNPAKVRKSRDDGLIELDFPATQAALQGTSRAHEDEDPFVDERGQDHYEPDRTQAPRRGGGGLGGIEEEGSEEEGEDEMPPPVQPNPRREGFRTAAVQRDRDMNKAMQTLQEEPESSPLPELGGLDEPLVPTQADSSDAAAPGETAEPPAAAVADVKGSMVETPLDSEAELPPSAQSSKHIEPPSHIADEMEDALEPAMDDEVEAAGGALEDAEAEAEEMAEEVADVMELDPEDAASRTGPELADPVECDPKAGAEMEAVELSLDQDEDVDEEPAAKRPKRLSHKPLFAPATQTDGEQDSEDELPEKLEVSRAGASKPPPRDARKEVGVPVKQMTTAHKVGAMKGLPQIGKIGHAPPAGPAIEHSASSQLAVSSSQRGMPKFDLHFPTTFTPAKPVPLDLRRATVESLFARLNRALIAPSRPPRVTDGTSPALSPAAEDTAWAVLGAGRALTRDQRKDSLLEAAVALEGELFWMTVSVEGYKCWSNEVKVAVARVEKHVGKGDGGEAAERGLGMWGPVMSEGDVWRAVRAAGEKVAREGTGKRKRA